MVEIPFCVFLRMKMHTKIHFIRKKSTKMTSGGLLGPRPGGVTKSVQKGPGRQLTKNRSNDVSRSHSGGLLEASKFSDFLGGWLRRTFRGHNMHPESHFIRKFTYKIVIICIPRAIL